MNPQILASLLGASTGSQVAPAATMGAGVPGAGLLSAMPFLAMGAGVQQAQRQAASMNPTGQRVPNQQMTQQQMAQANKKRGYRFLNPRGQMVTGFFAANEVPQGAIPMEN